MDRTAALVLNTHTHTYKYIYICVYMLNCFSHVSLLLHGPWPTRLLCPSDFPGKNTGVGCHALLQGIYLIQGSNPHLLYLPQYRWILYLLATREANTYKSYTHMHTYISLSHRRHFLMEEKPFKLRFLLSEPLWNNNNIMHVESSGIKLPLFIWLHLNSSKA